MGNCVLRGFGEVDGMVIKVVTCNGGIMELHPPVTAEHITDGFPGHGVFRSDNNLSPSPQPLLHNEELAEGELYYLRPLTGLHPGLPSLVAPYRMSSDHHGLWKRQEMELLTKCSIGGGGGMWKVKLVISPAQLAEILTQESRTEALIESVRTVAKCGGGTASAAGSDQWSLASSRKAWI